MNMMDEARRITDAYLGKRPTTLIDEFGDTTIVQPEPTPIEVGPLALVLLAEQSGVPVDFGHEPRRVEDTRRVCGICGAGFEQGSYHECFATYSGLRNAVEKRLRGERR